ncbi:MAG: hypothetical protein WKG01_37470, partial [Kofleriaceae bacterium]
MRRLAIRRAAHIALDDPAARSAAAHVAQIDAELDREGLRERGGEELARWRAARLGGHRRRIGVRLRLR